MLRVVARLGYGYACRHFHTVYFWPFNGSGRFPLSHSIRSGKIRVQLQRTCFRHAVGAVSCLLVCLSCIDAGPEPYRFFSSPAYSLQPLPSGDIYSGPSGPQGVDLCLCNTIAYSLISACDGCQAGGTAADWSRYDSRSFFSFQLQGLMHLPLAGQSMRPTARRYCLPAREFPAVDVNLMRSTLTLVCRFPYPIPAGTSLQRWAIADIPVRC